MRYALHKPDANQKTIVDGLRKLGVKVHILGGKGLPDLLIGHRFNFWLFELKDGDKTPSQRKLRPGQQKFADEWAGYPICKIESLEEACTALGIRIRTERGRLNSND